MIIRLIRLVIKTILSTPSGGDTIKWIQLSDFQAVTQLQFHLGGTEAVLSKYVNLEKVLCSNIVDIQFDLQIIRNLIRRPEVKELQMFAIYHDLNDVPSDEMYSALARVHKVVTGFQEFHEMGQHCKIYLQDLLIDERMSPVSKITQRWMGIHYLSRAFLLKPVQQFNRFHFNKYIDAFFINYPNLEAEARWGNYFRWHYPYIDSVSFGPFDVELSLIIALLRNFNHLSSLTIRQPTLDQSFCNNLAELPGLASSLNSLILVTGHPSPLNCRFLNDFMRLTEITTNVLKRRDAALELINSLGCPSAFDLALHETEQYLIDGKKRRTRNGDIVYDLETRIIQVPVYFEVTTRGSLKCTEISFNELEKRIDELLSIGPFPNVYPELPASPKKYPELTFFI